MLIVAQSGRMVAPLQNLVSIFADGNNKVRCAYVENRGAEGSELARYDSQEQIQYVMESLELAYEQGEKSYHFPTIEQLRQNMATARQQTSYAKTSSRRSMHGGS